jgi:hypothetical protein
MLDAIRITGAGMTDGDWLVLRMRMVKTIAGWQTGTAEGTYQAMLVGETGDRMGLSRTKARH